MVHVESTMVISATLMLMPGMVAEVLFVTVLSPFVRVGHHWIVLLMVLMLLLWLLLGVAVVAVVIVELVY